MFSAMIVSPLSCIRPNPVLLGRFPVEMKFSKGLSKVPVLVAHAFIIVGVRSNVLPTV